MSKTFYTRLLIRLAFYLRKEKQSMKSNKLLGVLALALSLSLVACGGGSNTGKSSKHVHTAAENAPWQSDDNYHWKNCVANDGGKVDNKKHDFGEPYDIVAAQCEQAGSQKVRCQTCGKEVTQTITALGHELPADTDTAAWTVTVEAKCEEGGKKKATCSRCQKEVEVDTEPAGHLYAKVKDDQGNDTEEDAVNWTTAPSCEIGGEGVKACIRPGCTHTEPVTADPLGHKWQSKDGQMVPAQGPGYADFYTYECANGCGQVSLGFKANQPTAGSKERLVFEPAEVADGQEQGARFWGRPIGNALALDSDGTSINQTNYECVYSTAETGDYFEYKFDLTAAQAQTLATCRCYVDAKPANYLNGADFWACSASADEWTPGFYIDGAEDHVEKNEDGSYKMVKDHAPAARTAQGETGVAGVELETEVKQGKRISNYRYILYVDDNVCAFDETITAPTSGNNTNMRRGEFVMPYTFHLHSGTNTISLRMAGGYRSLFYNFYFRQYVEPAAPQA